MFYKTFYLIWGSLLVWGNSWQIKKFNLLHFIGNSHSIKTSEHYEMTNNTKYIALSIFQRFLSPQIYFNEENLKMLKLCSLRLAVKVKIILFSQMKLLLNQLCLTQSHLSNLLGFRDLSRRFSNLNFNYFASLTSIPM